MSRHISMDKVLSLFAFLNSEAIIFQVHNHVQLNARPRVPLTEIKNFQQCHQIEFNEFFNRGNK